MKRRQSARIENMMRQKQFFGIPILQAGAAMRRNALIISALVMGAFSPVFAANPVTSPSLKTSAVKEVQTKASSKSADIKVGAGKTPAVKTLPGKTPAGKTVVGKTTEPKPSAEKIARGKFLFDKLTCSGCHPNGENSLHPYRPLKGPGFLARYKEDGQIEQIIRTGVLKAGMPSFSKARVDDNDMTDLIAYIRSLTPASAKNELKK